MTREEIEYSIGKYFVHLRGKNFASIEKISNFEFIQKIRWSNGKELNINGVKISYRDTYSVICNIDKVPNCGIFDTVEEAKLFINLNGFRELGSRNQQSAPDMIGFELGGMR